MEWFSPQVILSLVINLASLGYVIGTFATRIKFIENQVIEMKTELHELRDLHKEMATIQTELKNVNQTLLRFEQYIKGA